MTKEFLFFRDTISQYIIARGSNDRHPCEAKMRWRYKSSSARRAKSQMVGLYFTDNWEMVEITQFGAAASADICDDGDPEIRHVEYSLHHHYCNLARLDVHMIHCRSANSHMIIGNVCSFENTLLFPLFVTTQCPERCMSHRNHCTQAELGDG